VRVVAGQYDGVSGPVTEIAAQPLYMDVTLKAGEEFSLPVPMGHTVVAYVFEGRGLFGDGADHIVEAVRMLTFGEGDLVLARAAPNSHVRFMLMAGAPIGEPIVPYGPFVMNTEAEIMQAMTDLRNGTFVQN
jgi:redox-sensitive bicupin YhaK (pirin superfamily)